MSTCLAGIAHGLIEAADEGASLEGHPRELPAASLKLAVDDPVADPTERELPASLACRARPLDAVIRGNCPRPH